MGLWMGGEGPGGLGGCVGSPPPKLQGAPGDGPIFGAAAPPPTPHRCRQRGSHRRVITKGRPKGPRPADAPPRHSIPGAPSAAPGDSGHTWSQRCAAGHRPCAAAAPASPRPSRPGAWPPPGDGTAQGLDDRRQTTRAHRGTHPREPERVLCQAKRPPPMGPGRGIPC